MNRVRIKLGWDKSVSVMAVGALLAAASNTVALNIVPNFTGGSAPGNTAGGGNLIDIFNVAADWWELAIGDSHTANVNFGWGALGGSVLGEATVSSSMTPPSSGGTISFDNDGSNLWFLDPTPLDNAEYSTFTEYSADIGGGTINTGRVYTSPIGDAIGRYDLLSVAKHEIGHTLGILNLPNFPKWGNPITVTSPRPHSGTAIPTTNTGGGHINISTSLMFPSTSLGTRTVVSGVDILAAAELNNFTNVNLNPTAATEVTFMFQQGDGGYFGTQDTYLDATQPNTSFGSAPVVFIDLVSPPADGLLRFDNIFGNEVGQIPLGASTISSATLTLNVENNAFAPTDLHRMLQPWTEADTWNSMGGGITPDNIQAIALPDVVFTPTPVGTLDIPVTTSLQAWSQGAANHGWAFLADGWSFSSSEHSADVANRPMLVVTAVTLPGDANLDGMVSFVDFSILQNNFGQPGGFIDGDFNGDGFVTFADFAILQTNFGMTVAPATVPEPGTLTLLALGSLTLLRRRRGAISSKDF